MYWFDENRNGQVDEDYQCVLETDSFDEALSTATEFFNRGEYHTSFVVDCEASENRGHEVTIPVPIFPVN